MDVSIDYFGEHLAWLNNNGYKVVSVQNVFDAGYLRFYTGVFPLLKKYRYSASIALAGIWMGGNITADEPGKPLLNWVQIRELVQSGLVEIASHSYDLHKSANADPQEAAVTRIYDVRCWFVKPMNDIVIA